MLSLSQPSFAAHYHSETIQGTNAYLKKLNIPFSQEPVYTTDNTDGTVHVWTNGQKPTPAQRGKLHTGVVTCRWDNELKQYRKPTPKEIKASKINLYI